MSMMVELVGSVAAVLTTASFVPQAVKVIRSRETAAISLLMYTMFSAGVFCWLLYGIALRSWPIILANAVTLALAVTILTVKVQSERRAGRSLVR